MLPTLADEILAELSALIGRLPAGPMARDVAAHLASDLPSVRRAFLALETDGRARLIRRGKALHLVPADYPALSCCICRAEYERGRKSKRVTCSKACAVALSWRDPEKVKARVASIEQAHRTPESRARRAAANHRRFAQPGEREKVSEQNRKRWRDPVARAERSVAIAKAHNRPGQRKARSDGIKARWNDPEARKKLVDGIRKSKGSPEARALFSRLLKARWDDPVWREKYTAANRERNAIRRRKKQAASSEGAPA